MDQKKSRCMPALPACFLHVIHHWWHWMQEREEPSSCYQQDWRCAASKINKYMKIEIIWYSHPISDVIKYMHHQASSHWHSNPFRRKYLVKRNFLHASTSFANSKWHCKYGIGSKLEIEMSPFININSEFTKYNDKGKLTNTFCLHHPHSFTVPSSCWTMKLSIWACSVGSWKENFEKTFVNILNTDMYDIKNATKNQENS